VRNLNEKTCAESGQVRKQDCWLPEACQAQQLTRERDPSRFSVLGVGESTNPFLRGSPGFLAEHRATSFPADREPLARHRSGETWVARLRAVLPIGHARTTQLTGQQEKENDSSSHQHTENYGFPFLSIFKGSQPSIGAWARTLLLPWGVPSVFLPFFPFCFCSFPLLSSEDPSAVRTL